MKDNQFYEKLLILIVTFVLVAVVTGGIIGYYVKIKNENERTKPRPNTIILDNINLL